MRRLHQYFGSVLERLQISVRYHGHRPQHEQHCFRSTPYMRMQAALGSMGWLWLLGLFMVAGGGMPVEAQPFAYVATLGADTVSVINTATAVADPAQAVVDLIPVASSPASVAITPDGAFAYVTPHFASP